MDLLFITQYTCFIFMVINAMILGISSIHVRWKNKRYEQSRWLFFGVSGNLVGISINLCKSIQKELFINDTP